MPISNLRGHKFGRLRIPKDAVPTIGAHGYAYWPCTCKCGNVKSIRGSNLVSGDITSCGCAKSDSDIRRAAKMKTPAKRRQQIAREAAAARWR